MPVVKLPLTKGLAQNSTEYDWIDSLPINMLSIKKPILGAEGYMHSWPGLLADEIGTGDNAIMPMDRARNGIYNTETNSTFRINGDQLQEYKIVKGALVISSRVKSILGLPDNPFDYVPMDYSTSTVAYIAQGADTDDGETIQTLHFLNRQMEGDDRPSVVQLSNWEDGRKPLNRERIYSFNFDGTKAISIPTLVTAINAYLIHFEIAVNEFRPERRQLLGNDSSTDGLVLQNDKVTLEVAAREGMNAMSFPVATIRKERTLQTVQARTRHSAGTMVYTPFFDGNTVIRMEGLTQSMFPSNRIYFVSFDVRFKTLPNNDVILQLGGGVGNRETGFSISAGITELYITARGIFPSRMIINSNIILDELIHVSTVIPSGIVPAIWEGLLPTIGAQSIPNGAGLYNPFIGEIRNVQVRFDNANGKLLINYPLTQIKDSLPTNAEIISSITGQKANIIKTGPIRSDLWINSGVIENSFNQPINLIGQPQSRDKSSTFIGEIRNLTFVRDEVDGAMNPERRYDLLEFILPNNDAPTTEIIADITGGMDGSIRTDPTAPDGVQTSIWRISDYGARGEEATTTPATDYPLNKIIDVVRNQARYIYIREGDRDFWITDLDNERKIEYYSPSYDGNSHYGTPVGIESWRNYVVVVSKHNVTFYQLTGRGGSATQPIYQIDPSLTVQCGALHKGAVCRYRDHFVVVGSPVNEPVSVYLITNGSYQEIASRFVQQILRRKDESELRQIYIEPFKFDSHDGFILHLDDRTLLFNPSEKDFEWKELSSNSEGTEQYRAMYHVFEENRKVWTAGDRLTNTTNILDFDIASHRNDENGNPIPVIHQVDTPMIQVRNVKLFDFEIDNVVGDFSGIQTVDLSATYDGQTFLPAQSFTLEDAADSNRRILVRNLGYSRNNIGFRLSWVTAIPASISDFRIRIEN